MGAPLDQFLSILFRGPLRSASLPTIRGPLRSSVCILLLHVYGALSNQFLCILYRGPLRSALSLTIWGPLRSVFYLLYGAPLSLVSVLTIWGPLRSVFVDTTCIWGPPQVSFFAYYRGPPQISFFAYYMGPPSSQFLRLLYGGLLMPVSSLTMWAPRSVSLHTIWGPLRSVS